MENLIFFFLNQDNGNNATLLDLDRIEVTSDANGTTSVFNCTSVIKGGANAINIPKIWVRSPLNYLRCSKKLKILPLHCICKLALTLIGYEVSVLIYAFSYPAETSSV
jgi:hypothetical protein